MTERPRMFYQSHESAGYRAKMTVEWSWPDDKDPPQEWLNRAEEIAEEVSAAFGKTYDMVLAMRGKTK